MIIMYMGLVEDWIKKQEKESYVFDNNKDLITKYIDVLKHGSEPLYSFQAKSIKTYLDMVESQLSDKIINDLRNLGDKDLIIKYDLEPKTVSHKYVSVNVDDIKPSLKRLDIDIMRDGFIKQYEMFAERGWL